MLTSLAYIFLAGLAMAGICQQLKIPRIIGMLAVGILLGPSVLNLLDPSILSVSADLRKMALIIILLKAGLSLNIADLKRVGRPAVMMSFVPASFEILGFVLLGPVLLGLSVVEAAVMGAVLAAVSPAVVVPRMVQLMESHYGTDKSIPQLIMVGASCDDIFVIVVFTTFTGMAQGSGARLSDFGAIPVSILLGILLGVAVGWLVSLFFETAYAHHCTGYFLPAGSRRNLAQALGAGVRSAGRHQHGLYAAAQKHCLCFQTAFGKIRQTVAGR